MRSAIPITVIGGYLGAGKTTLLNALLRDPGGRRLGVIVNDFGQLGVDASLIGLADGSSAPIANLANGCVCCTLGEDLGTTLMEMAAMRPALDHIVIETSGVADPAATASWGTLRPFVPGGTVVLAAADRVRRMARDRYVGDEVLRQLVGADLLVVTRSDLVDSASVADVVQWLGAVSDAPVIEVAHGDVGTDIILGCQPIPASDDAELSDASSSGSADDRYERWSWRPDGPVLRRSLDAFLADLSPGLLRLKGVLLTSSSDGSDVVAVLVQVVGASVSVTVVPSNDATGLEAIGIRGVFDPSHLDQSAVKYLRRA